ncbi:Hypothetical protein, putative [Bodo saltans]|uniref:Uncharacterized protein n=1 Tax=Bodo saltans TaxID=75058 RepID=A0A0S4JKS9_BODSA|nr:Hypothetical protein, putative [Bodo saltans]|eukprot:CUG90729.1 Hypothetical protein, putative [Bodo saltans]
MKSLADLLNALEEEQSLAQEEEKRAQSKNLVILAPCDHSDAAEAKVPGPSTFTMNTATLEEQLMNVTAHLNQLRASHSHPIQEMDGLRSNLLDLRRRLVEMLQQCGVDHSSVMALTEAAECDDLADLFEEVPSVWAQSTDTKCVLSERTIQLRLMQRLATARKLVSTHLASSRSIVSLTKREKRLRNDLDECRVVIEFIGYVSDRIEHVVRMVTRSTIDESALLDLHKTTILEEERARFHVAGNDIRGLKAITNGHKMKSVKQAAILPEIGSLESLLRQKSSAERTTFPDIGRCHAAWKGLESHCEAILEMVTETRDSHQSRRLVADVAYETVMQSLATRTIASIR